MCVLLVKPGLEHAPALVRPLTIHELLVVLVGSLLLPVELRHLHRRRPAQAHEIIRSLETPQNSFMVRMPKLLSTTDAEGWWVQSMDRASAHLTAASAVPG
jgi:hypothetical protein